MASAMIIAPVNNDIETNTPTVGYEPLRDIKGILIKPDTNKEALNAEKIGAAIGSAIIIIISFPMIFCDYYYAITYNDCMKQPLNISLTMYDYLMVNAIYGTATVIIVFFTLMYVDLKKFNEKSSWAILFKFVTILTTMFSTAWVITGGIMYWGNMDKSICSKSANDYLTATLIIKILMTAQSFTNNNKSKDKK